MADQYKIASIAECVLLFAQLPEDRADVFLAELATVISTTALTMRLMAVTGGPAPMPQQFTWVDDDEKKVTFRLARNSTEEG